MSETTSVKKVIMEVRGPGSAANMIPILEGEGWHDIELSITPYGTLYIHGVRGPKPREKKVKALGPKRSSKRSRHAI